MYVPLDRAAIVFPGQGAQAPAMAAPWHDTSAWHVVETAESVLERRLDQLLLDPDLRPTSTTETQLCVLVTSLLAWEYLQQSLRGTGGPLAVAGHSLGQFAALVAAGTLTTADAIRLVAIRGSLTEATCRRHPGGMVAVLGVETQLVETVCRRSGSWIANDNAPGQLVIAGTEQALGATEQALAKLGVGKTIRLDVAGPFHTPLMAPAAREFTHHLRSVPFTAPNRPVVRNSDGQVAGAETDWTAELTTHLTAPVRWRDTQRRLVELGATSLVELGHGTTLTSIARRTVSDVRLISISDPHTADRLHDPIPETAQTSA
ncbi:ACP S-malonyltransferase [Lipingzhangella sp. LS1_29]|uniref:Malonyl CoA-acyl carrier protein transacylase n=1 Tax=Lipingzhangella rawalii TaxID=2055835 RepID=A0ABU2H2M2_9ACTN|nr:ACP S-malonyltransferase [Lipingzhangella rawalii]MDS1269237.1 ACP S-malonyltransferase [Lipingzhangella rawalii]